jgi:aspartyl-tRNA(Asn)/glutamyl-tRNA(Gln) amidotransferase subunit B
VRREGSTEFGTKVELKNLNSVRFMQRAIEYEIERHINLIEAGGRVVQETLLWDDRANEARAMRSKEEAHDYRYFPEPDLPPLVVTEEFIKRVREEMPELPEMRRTRFMNEYELSYTDAAQLTSDRALADYYEQAARASNNPRAAANWIKTELLRELETAKLTIEESRIAPEALGELIRFIDEGTISGKQGKDVLTEMFGSGKARHIIAEQGLVQVSDAGEIESVISEVISASPQQLAQYRAGKESLRLFVGQVMKASKAKPIRR